MAAESKTLSELVANIVDDSDSAAHVELTRRLGRRARNVPEQDRSDVVIVIEADSCKYFVNHGRIHDGYIMNIATWRIADYWENQELILEQPDEAIEDSAWVDGCTSGPQVSPAFQADLSSFLGSLPENEHKIAHMAFIERRTKAEIAEEFGMSLREVTRLKKSFLHKFKAWMGGR